MSLNNIHPTAIVDPNAKLGENVKIGAYSIIYQRLQLVMELLWNHTL